MRLRASLCWILAPLSMVVVSMVVVRAQDFPPELLKLMEVEGGIRIVDGQPMPVQPGGTPADAEANTTSERLKKLQTLDFDRRPSAILKAWSTPPPKPEEVSPEDSKEDSEENEEKKPEGTPPSTEEGAEEEGDSNADTKEEEADSEDAEQGTDEDEGPPRELTAEELAKKAEKEAQEQAEAAKKAQEEAAKKAKEEAERKAAEAKALEEEMKRFQRMVTLGQWSDVKTYLASLDEKEAKAGYNQLIKSLQTGPKDRPKNAQQARYAEKNVFSPQDVLALADVAPHEIEIPILTSIGSILSQCLTAGHVIERFLELVDLGYENETSPLTTREVSRVLFAANRPVEAGKYLPGPKVAIEKDDREALNMLSRYFLAKHSEDQKSKFLEQAWEVTQAALAAGEIEDEQKEEALKRAVDLAPKLREELGQSWLNESFTERPERGMEILSTIGASVSKGLRLQGRSPTTRLKGLELQTTAANALLAASPERAESWRETLNLLASNWLREAVYSYQNDQSTRRRPMLQRDVFGNYFYSQQSYSNRSGSRPQPITTGDILKIRPSDQWLTLADEALKPKFSILFAQLLLKVGEEAEAFPYIERLALTFPDYAKDLIDEFLRVWARNHNPNTNNNTNPYMFMYGFDNRAAGIPLTRSKQQRNLKELAEWVARLRKLPTQYIDVELLANCFTAAHSSAEVYRLETIQGVFGSLDHIEPKTLASLAHRMRANLASVWRDPAVQKDAKTRRHKKDIQNEVLGGYETAKAVLDGALMKYPDDWRLLVARASFAHDENNYLQEIKKSAEYATRRNDAMKIFQKAARHYAATVPALAQEDETTQAFETWFYAALGACDLNGIKPEMQLATAEVTQIRESLLGLPGDAADRHVGMFANSLFTRMSNANPAVKFRYLRTGLEIVGDHERGEEAKEVLDYYKDLVTEITLETEIDGRDTVGTEEPFGLWIHIRHTKEIERESGGFGKYLTNQNNQYYSYNYGRPTEDYRDKFEEAAREALGEQFEVLSMTFNHPDTKSKATEEWGWRVTPYAYALLKPRGPEIDRVPSLRLDMDFLDTSGYAIIPVESSPVPIDARSKGEERPYRDLDITQTLDERQAKKGKLVLEVKATARGLVPAFDKILQLRSDGFEIDTIEDQGVSVSEFDQEADELSVSSQREWMVTMKGRTDLDTLPETFSFAEPLVDATMEYQRFEDADLAKAESTIALEYEYGETQTSWLWWGVPSGVLILGLLGFLLARSLSSTAVVADGRFQMPESVTPFTTLGVLRSINGGNGISAGERGELESQIASLESFYFDQAEGGKTRGEEPDLVGILDRWVKRSN